MMRCCIRCGVLGPKVVLIALQYDGACPTDYTQGALRCMVLDEDPGKLALLVLDGGRAPEGASNW